MSARVIQLPKRYKNELMVRINLQLEHARDPRRAGLLRLLHDAISALPATSPFFAEFAEDGQEGFYVFEDRISGLGAASFIGGLIDKIEQHEWDDWFRRLPGPEASA